MKIHQFDPAFTETLAHYVGAAVGLTLVIWLLAIALQKKNIFYLRRGLWPFFYVYDLIRRYKRTNRPLTPQTALPQAMLYFVLEETPRESNPI